MYGQDLHAGEQRLQMGGDDLLEPDEVVRVRRGPIPPYTARRASERDQTRQRARNLHPCKAFFPSGIDGSAPPGSSLKIGDMGEWPPWVKRQRCQDREDHLFEILPQRRPLGGGPGRYIPGCESRLPPVWAGDHLDSSYAPLLATWRRPDGSPPIVRLGSGHRERVLPRRRRFAALRPATRTMKNSSRFEPTMARNFKRSSSGLRSSIASSRTRRKNSN